MSRCLIVLLVCTSIFSLSCDDDPAVPDGPSDTPSSGTATLDSRISLVYAGSANIENCPVAQYDDSMTAMIDSVSIAASRVTSCAAPSGNGNGAASAFQTSYPGFTPDGASANITFQTSAAVSAQSTGTFIFDCDAISMMNVSFDVANAPMRFEFDAAFDGTIGEMTVFLLAGATNEFEWEKIAGDGLASTFEVSGTLPPGSYGMSFSLNGKALANGAESVSGTFAGTATLRLLQAAKSQRGVLPTHTRTQ